MTERVICRGCWPGGVHSYKDRDGSTVNCPICGGTGMVMAPRFAPNATPPKEEGPKAEVVVGGVYLHRKGGIYRVEAIALESTNGRPRERVVVYRGRELNVRTEREFLESVDGEPRFKLTSAPVATPAPAAPQDEAAAEDLADALADCRSELRKAALIRAALAAAREQGRKEGRRSLERVEALIAEFGERPSEALAYVNEYVEQALIALATRTGGES